MDLFTVQEYDEHDEQWTVDDKEKQLTLARPHRLEDFSYGPLRWNTRSSVELQQVIDSFNCSQVRDTKFSFTIADPRAADCPLVACSSGFSELTGYYLQEIVGRNCRFLLNGVPPMYLNENTRFRARDFCTTVHKNVEYQSDSEELPLGVKKAGFALPKNEIVCSQTNAAKGGDLFRNMFYMKQVWLDDDPYIIGLQAGIPEPIADAAALQELQAECAIAWENLGKRMTVIEQMLAEKFSYASERTE